MTNMNPQPSVTNSSSTSTHSHWLTVNQLSQAEIAFTKASIRNLIFNSADRKASKGTIKGNGLASHIRRVGAKVLINHQGFLSWIDSQNGAA